MVEDVIETQTAKIWLRADGIICQVISPQAEIRLEDAKENFESAVKLCEENHFERLLILTDISEVKSTSRETRVFSSSSEVAKEISANAIIVQSALSRMGGNLYLGINKPPYPAKLFTSEEKAIEWLKGFIEM